MLASLEAFAWDKVIVTTAIKNVRTAVAKGLIIARGLALTSVKGYFVLGLKRETGPKILRYQD
jgi:hypothetical protein